MVASGASPEIHNGEDHVSVVVPFRDYTIPVDGRDLYTDTVATWAAGFLKLSTGGYLLLSTGGKLIILGGGELQAPTVVVPYRDYIIPVSERTDG